MMDFKDHFSGHPADYARYRPVYPAALYEHLYRYVHRFDTAWDAGTGNGQVAVELARRFDKVFATDASAAQLKEAIPDPRVEYLVSKAEQTVFPDHCFDLISVGQAIHWFGFDRFFNEVERVGRPGGAFACWTYRFLTVDRETDEELAKFFALIEPFWPPERSHVEARYTTIPFPGHWPEIDFPDMYIKRDMTAEGVLNYLSTWSAVKNYRQRRSDDPLRDLRIGLHRLWNHPGEQRTVRHPLVTRLFLLPG